MPTNPLAPYRPGLALGHDAQAMHRAFSPEFSGWLEQTCPAGGCARPIRLTATDPLDTWLASAFTPHHIEQTITAMADAQPLDQPPALATAAQAIITECDAKLGRYRAALDAGADPAVVTDWISQTQTLPTCSPEPGSHRVLGRRRMVSCRPRTSAGTSAGSRSRIGRLGSALTNAANCQRHESASNQSSSRV